MSFPLFQSLEPRTMSDDRGSTRPNRRDTAEIEVRKPVPRGRKSVVTYLIYYIDEALSPAPSKTTDNVNSFLSREYLLDKDHSSSRRG